MNIFLCQDIEPSADKGVIEQHSIQITRQQLMSFQVLREGGYEVSMVLSEIIHEHDCDTTAATVNIHKNVVVCQRVADRLVIVDRK